MGGRTAWHDLLKGCLPPANSGALTADARPRRRRDQGENSVSSDDPGACSLANGFPDMSQALGFYTRLGSPWWFATPSDAEWDVWLSGSNCGHPCSSLSGFLGVAGERGGQTCTIHTAVLWVGFQLYSRVRAGGRDAEPVHSFGSAGCGAGHRPWSSHGVHALRLHSSCPMDTVRRCDITSPSEELVHLNVRPSLRETYVGLLTHRRSYNLPPTLVDHIFASCHDASVVPGAFGKIFFHKL